MANSEADSLTNNINGKKTGFRWYHFLLILFFCVLISVSLIFWWFNNNLNAKNFNSVELSQQEEKALEDKLESLERADFDGSSSSENPNSKAPSQNIDLENIPTNSEGEGAVEAYSEEGADREVYFSERELNHLISKEPELAKIAQVNLSQDLVTIRMIIPIDEDFPFFSGRKIKIKSGLKLAYRDEKPLVSIQGVSLGGIPLPSAWLGGLKYKDLIQEFGTEDGFWSAFSKGVDDIEVLEGSIRIKLKE